MNDWLAASRRASNLTIAEIAKSTNLGMSSVWKYQKDPGETRLKSLERWYDACNDQGKQLIRSYLKQRFF